MKRFVFVLSLLLFVGFNLLQGQGVQVTGTVTSADDGTALPGVSVVVRGTTIGAVTDFEGKYTITVPNASATLMYSFVGMLTQEIVLQGQTTVDVVMESTSMELDEVVVTALGVSREKKSLGYAIQEVDGGAVNDVPSTNFTEALSGKLAGVQIKMANTMGGANNVVIRGSTSLTGNNQAMFVIDGVPVDNTNVVNQTDRNMMDGWGGYDYGNVASDINPNDIESISVLKGAAASALYGSRAANGVILVTTKKGKARKGVGVSINSNFMVSKIDKSTLPTWQREYGAGYGPFYEDASGYFFEGDVDGDGVLDLVTPTSEDASWGHKFDPNLMVMQWDALDPTDDMFGEKRPWVAPPLDRSMPSFFETGTTWINSVSFDGGNKDGNFRLSYTNHDEKGILPNSSIKKNSVNFAGSYNFTKRLTVNANVSYLNQSAVGRYGTGYDAGNVMQSFGQWCETQLDFERLKNYISPTGMQRTWNYNYWNDLTPIYFDNPYWVRYKNYEDDSRNRILGYTSVDYKFADWLTATLRVAVDSWTDIQNERIAKGSNPTSDYTNYTRTFLETNTDLILKFNKNFGDISLNGLVGGNIRDMSSYRNRASTVGGLSAENLYTVGNSVSPASVIENNDVLGERSLFADVSVGYKNLVYVEGTARMDKSSSLPSDNNTFVYPSVAASLILSELGGLKDATWLDFAKLRVNYAEVGLGTDAYRTSSTYTQGTNWGSMSLFSVNSILQNPDLLPEKTKSIEAGLEGHFFQRRLGFDFAIYKTTSLNQIMPVDVSRASGYTSLILNGGEIENKGMEIAAYVVPVRSGDFEWTLNLNWYANRNMVISLPAGIQNYQIYSNWDVSINAKVGEPYGNIQGTDYVWTNGKHTVGDDGYLLISDDILVTIGNIQPDWNMGIGNALTWKGLRFYALIDIQKGGDIFSINNKYGLSTGVYEETAGNNPKGNPQRDLVADGGGNIFEDAVKEDGTPNDIYVEAYRWGRFYDYNKSPTARYVYDASYVKLRELSLSYSLPGDILGDSFIRGVELALVGRNLWIIHKNAPHFDPEASKQTSGNNQGIESGAYPTPRTIGLNLRLNF
jgi:TonB-linked SusC/RagA family outer membrane protein